MFDQGFAEEWSDVNNCYSSPSRASCHVLYKNVPHDEAELIAEVVGDERWAAYKKWLLGGHELESRGLDFINLTIFQIAPFAYFMAYFSPEGAPTVPTDPELVDLYHAISRQNSIEARLRIIAQSRKVLAEQIPSDQPRREVGTKMLNVHGGQRGWILTHLTECPKCWKELLSGKVPAHLRCQHRTSDGKQCRHYALDQRGFCSEHEVVPQEERCITKSCKKRRKRGRDHCPDCEKRIAKREAARLRRQQDQERQKEAAKAKRKAEREAEMAKRKADRKAAREAEKLKLQQERDAKRCTHKTKAGKRCTKAKIEGSDLCQRHHDQEQLLASRCTYTTSNGQCKGTKIPGSDYCQTHHDREKAKKEAALEKLMREADRENVRRDREVVKVRLQEERERNKAERELERLMREADRENARRDRQAAKTERQAEREAARLKLQQEREAKRCERTTSNGKRCKADKIDGSKYCQKHHDQEEARKPLPDHKRCIAKPGGHRCKRERDGWSVYCVECGQREKDREKRQREKDAKRCVHKTKAGRRCSGDKIDGSKYCQRHHDKELLKESRCSYAAGNGQCKGTKIPGSDYCQTHHDREEAKKEAALEKLMREAERENARRSRKARRVRSVKPVRETEGECSFVYPKTGKKCTLDAHKDTGYCTLHERYAEDVPARNDAERCLGKRTRGRCSKKKQVGDYCFGCDAKNKQN